MGNSPTKKTKSVDLVGGEHIGENIFFFFFFFFFISPGKKFLEDIAVGLNQVCNTIEAYFVFTVSLNLFYHFMCRRKILMSSNAH